MIVELIADRYRKQNDFASAIICLQAGVFGGESLLGEKNSVINRISKKAENLYSVLGEDDMKKVSIRHFDSKYCTLIHGCLSINN